MKIVRENINLIKMVKDIPYLNFEKSGEPLKDIDLGMKARISQWLDMMEIEDYRINKDLSIDVAQDVNLIGQELEELPEFIKFNKIWGGFYAGGNPWQSLKGFPNEVYGDLQINSISNFIENGLMNPKINEKSIKKLIKVHGKIWV